ncbi:multidrug ABC transporter permease [Streptococcus pneumoniae]|nr:multidrug ABC transporter permease [Streptococcus pneumoniae]VSD16961.1 multidrug ABC transporter permease [Streptococcus pneumoniae]
MKRWIALSKIEFLLTKRQLIYYLLSIVGRDADGFLFIFFWYLSGHTR